MDDATVGTGAFEGFEYEMSVNYGGKMMTLITCPRESFAENVFEFARLVHAEKYRRNCEAVRVALEDERPESWKLNPVRTMRGEAWLLIVVWELDLPANLRIGGVG